MLKQNSAGKMELADWPSPTTFSKLRISVGNAPSVKFKRRRSDLLLCIGVLQSCFPVRISPASGPTVASTWLPKLFPQRMQHLQTLVHRIKRERNQISSATS